MHRFSPLVLGGLLLAAAPALSAQSPAASPPPRIFVGAHVQAAQPLGEFNDYTDTGFGAGAHFIFQPPQARGFGLRVDGAVVTYGSETRAVPLSPTVGGRILLDLSTTNSIATLAAGPQWMLPSGRIRPYVHVGAGLAYFVTDSSLRGTRDREAFASTTNFDDLTFSYGGGGGVYVPLRQGARPISLDIGARYHRNGEAEYLREGSIRDNPNGTISFTPIRSEADLVSFYAGVSVGVGQSRRTGR